MKVSALIEALELLLDKDGDMEAEINADLDYVSCWLPVEDVRVETELGVKTARLQI